MHETASAFEQHVRSGTPLPVRRVPRIPVMALGTSLGLFFALTLSHDVRAAAEAHHQEDETRPKGDTD